VDLDERIVSEFADNAKRRYEQGEINYSLSRFTINAAERLLEFSKTGNWVKRQVGRRSNLNDFFESLTIEIAEDWEMNNNWSDNTINRYLGSNRQHFTWLLENGHNEFDNVNEAVIRGVDKCAPIENPQHQTVILSRCASAATCFLRYRIYCKPLQKPLQQPAMSPIFVQSICCAAQE